MSVNAEQEFLKEIARGPALKTGPDTKIEAIFADNNINWDVFKQLIIYHQLIPLAYLRLKDLIGSLPAELAGFIKNNSYATLQRSHRFWREFTRIAGAFERSAVTLVPIKGVAFLADIYQDTFLRQMVDIDLLVQEEGYSHAEAILLDLGYKKELHGFKEEYWRENQYHIAFLRNNSSVMHRVELHWALDYKRKKRRLLPEIWQRLRDIQYDGKIIKLLSPEDSLFSLALHSRRFGENLCLKNVYDAILLMRKHEERFDWDYCLAMSEKYDMRTTLFFLLVQMQSFSGYAVPEHILKKLDIPALRRKAIRMFIARNTFSIKKLLRRNDIYLQLHFLLHDNILESLAYAINVPREQFAKFYGLKAYSKKTGFLYHWRFLYILKKLLVK
ncbi:MAG: nucleotidyltransferase family protein [Candidatus Omnitrophota bacterium]